MVNVETVVVVNFKPVMILNLLDGIKAITKVSVDYYKVIADVKNNCKLMNKINVKKKRISIGSFM